VSLRAGPAIMRVGLNLPSIAGSPQAEPPFCPSPASGEGRGGGYHWLRSSSSKPPTLIFPPKPGGGNKNVFPKYGPT